MFLLLLLLGLPSALGDALSGARRETQQLCAPPAAAGFYCPASFSAPLACPAGSTCAGGAAAPVTCAANFFCPPGSANALACPQLTVSASGSSSAAACLLPLCSSTNPPTFSLALGANVTVSTNPGSAFYSDNQDCSIQISGPFGSLLVASFISFSTEDLYDYVYVLDGTRTSLQLLQASGSTLPAPVVSSSTNLTLRFTSDYTVTRSGVVAIVSAVCSAGTYQAGTTCITCSAGTYSSYGASSCSSACPAGKDCGSGTAVPCPANSYCPAGSIIPLACPAGLTSPTGSSSSTACTSTLPLCSFTNSYMFSLALGANVTVTTNTPGSSYYDNNRDCSIALSGPTGSVLAVSFLSFRTDWSDYFYLLDGGTRTSAQLLQASGSTLPAPVVSSSTNLTLRFYSDNSATRSGVVAIVSAVCPAGTYQAGTACITCSAGTYSSFGAFSCSLSACPAGKYCAGIGAVPCPPNSYCPPGSANALACAAGTGSISGASSAADCLLPLCSLTNSFVFPLALGANVTVTTNALGKSFYSNNMNCSIALSGPTGSVLAVNFISFSTQSSDYFYVLDGGTPTSLFQASGSYYSPPPATAVSAFNNLTLRFTSDGGSTSLGVVALVTAVCPAGTYQAGTTCITCSTGAYSSYGASSCSASSTCPAGKYCGGGTAVPCPANSFCPAGSIIPLACPAGFASPAGSSSPAACTSTLLPLCLFTDSYMFSLALGANVTVTTNTPSNSYYSYVNNPDCSMALSGPTGSVLAVSFLSFNTAWSDIFFVLDGTRPSAQLLLAARYSTYSTLPATVVSSFSSVTLRFASGYYISPGVVALITAVCPAGAYQAGAACITCSAGTYSSFGASSCSSACPAGKHCGGGTAVPCPANSYCPAGSVYPLPCPAGLTSPTGSSLPVACTSTLPLCSFTNTIFSLPLGANVTVTTNTPGSSYYDNNLDCSIALSGPTGSVLSVSFISFSTQFSDSLYVLDGGTRTSAQLLQASGYTLPSLVVSSFNNLTLRFTTGGSGWGGRCCSGDGCLPSRHLSSWHHMYQLPCRASKSSRILISNSLHKYSTPMLIFLFLFISSCIGFQCDSDHQYSWKFLLRLQPGLLHCSLWAHWLCTCSELHLLLYTVVGLPVCAGWWHAYLCAAPPRIWLQPALNCCLHL